MMLILGIVLGAWLFSNLYVAVKMTAKEMVDAFILNQGIVGMMCANIFYAPAWLLKVMKTYIA